MISSLKVQKESQWFCCTFKFSHVSKSNVYENASGNVLNVANVDKIVIAIQNFALAKCQINLFSIVCCEE